MTSRSFNFEMRSSELCVRKKILRIYMNNNQMSASQIAKQVGCCAKTVYNNAAQPGELLDESETPIRIEKFGSKKLIWKAICQCGKASNFFATNGVLNSDTYITECLRKRLLPFLQFHLGSTIFWPDLASVHYSRKTRNWLEANNVSYVAKDMNPPNVPELRPIERYWSVLNEKLRNDGRITKSDADFSRILRKVSGQIERQLLQNLMNPIKRKLRSFSRLTLKK